LTDALTASAYTPINHQAIFLWYNVHMSDQHTITLCKADQARTDFALIEGDLECIADQLSRLPTRRDLAMAALGIIVSRGARHPVGGSVLATMMRTAGVPGAEHDREIADMLRESARSCQFAGARREILHLPHDSTAEPIISTGGRDRRPRHACADPRCPEAGLITVAVAVVIAATAPSAREYGSREVTREFQREHPCPSTGPTTGRCPGYRKDHVEPLACGGPDAVSNLQWQTIRDAKAKDRWERRACGR
jgi:hypothetical protein